MTSTMKALTSALNTADGMPLGTRPSSCQSRAMAKLAPAGACPRDCHAGGPARANRAGIACQVPRAAFGLEDTFPPARIATNRRQHFIHEREDAVLIEVSAIRTPRLSAWELASLYSARLAFLIPPGHFDADAELHFGVGDVSIMFPRGAFSTG
jgi:hypothetical protein